MTKEQFTKVEEVLMGIITDKASTVEDVLGAVDVLREFAEDSCLIIDPPSAPSGCCCDECCGEKCSND